jgi:hypothetical protein
MPTFDEEVIIELHGLVVRDAAGHEIARLDREGFGGDLVIHRVFPSIEHEPGDILEHQPGG